MKYLYTLIFLGFISNSYAQRYIGIPFLDKCKKISECDLCDTKNPKTIAYLDSLDIVLKSLIVEDEKKSALNQIEVLNNEIEHYKSIYTIQTSERTYEKEILGRLLMTKITLLIQSVVSEKDKIYNLALTEDEHYKKFSGVTEINSLFDEIIDLNISESTNLFCREVRLKYMYESYAFIEINNEDLSWYEKNNLQKIKQQPEDRLNAAKLFLEDLKMTEYIPFSSFDAFGIGAVGAIGKGTWVGYELSSEQVEYSKPFILANKISGDPHYRFSLFGTSYLWNINDRTKQDFLFNMLNYRHPYLNLNLIQFGLHYGISDKAKWLYRPEIGLSYGIFKVSYSYNLTFDKSLRSQTEKNLFTFGISYPLFRIGDYY